MQPIPYSLLASGCAPLSTLGEVSPMPPQPNPTWHFFVQLLYGQDPKGRERISLKVLSNNASSTALADSATSGISFARSTRVCTLLAFWRRRRRRAGLSFQCKMEISFYERELAFDYRIPMRRPLPPSFHLRYPDFPFSRHLPKERKKGKKRTPAGIIIIIIIISFGKKSKSITIIK